MGFCRSAPTITHASVYRRPLFDIGHQQPVGARPVRSTGSSDVNVLLVFLDLRSRLTPDGLPPQLEPRVRVDPAEEPDERADQPAPAGLMAGPDACAVVALEILVEEQVIPPV